jgi:hypothetical protein
MPGLLEKICRAFFYLGVRPLEVARHLHVIYADFFASSKNLANPISVNGCFNNPGIDSKGEVTTSAPASAHLII